MMIRLIVPVIRLSSLCFFLHIFLAHGCIMNVFVCGCVPVSAENVEKNLRQMERQLLQLQRDLETFTSPDDPNDMFFPKMDISFSPACVCSVLCFTVLG